MSGSEIHHKAGHPPVPRLLNVIDIFQLITYVSRE
jgi:hypothetical protein